MNNSVNEIAGYQYSIHSIFWILILSKKKHAYFGHLQDEYEMMASISINKVWVQKISKPKVNKLYNKII